VAVRRRPPADLTAGLTTRAGPARLLPCWPVRSVEVEPGVSLAVHVDGDGPATVVLVHGLASTAQLWAGVAADLAASGVRAVRLDLRGHGESDAPETGYDTATAASDVATAVRAVGPGPVVLAGQSWGGNVVLRVAAEHPDLVRGLALVDGGWIRLAGRFPDWPSALTSLTPPDIDGWPVQRFAQVVAASLAGFPAGAAQAAMSVVRVEADGTIRRRLPVERHLQILESMWQDDPRVSYPLVQAPTLLMPATDGEVPPDVVEAAGLLPHAAVRPYVGAHHDLHLQRPAEVAADLRSLL